MKAETTDPVEELFQAFPTPEEYVKLEIDCQQRMHDALLDFATSPGLVEDSSDPDAEHVLNLATSALAHEY